MKTLTKEAADTDAIHIWWSHLGAELGKLRAQIINNPTARAFRKQTYEIIKSLPLMVYHEVEEDVTQTYAVGTGKTSDLEIVRLPVTLSVLKPSQQDAWIVAENIGEFGHPLVRTVLDHAC